MFRTLCAALIAAGLLLLAVPALAGGWAVVTMDSLPSDVRAEEPLTIGLMVRQHGRLPTDAANPTLHAKNAVTGEQISSAGRQSGERGHYVIDVVFPSEGEWEWSIVALGPETHLAPLTVLPAVGPVAGAAATPERFPLQAVLRWAGLALLLGAAIMALVAHGRRQTPDVAMAGD